MVDSLVEATINKTTLLNQEASSLTSHIESIFGKAVLNAMQKRYAIYTQWLCLNWLNKEWQGWDSYGY